MRLRDHAGVASIERALGARLRPGKYAENANHEYDNNENYDNNESNGNLMRIMTTDNTDNHDNNYKHDDKQSTDKNDDLKNAENY